MILALLACGSGTPDVKRPENVPAGAAFLRYSGNDLKLDDTAIAPWKSLREGQVAAPFPPLVDALDARLTKEAGTWIALPGNATWNEGRRALQSVFQADAAPVWVGAMGTDKAFGPLTQAPAGEVLGDCSAPVVGVSTRLSLEVHANEEESWVDAHVRFLPLVRRPGEEPIIADLMPPECWNGVSCAVLGAPALVTACESAPDTVSDRLPVAGSEGCLLPFGKAHDHTAWPDALDASLARLGFAGPSFVLADENVELSAILALLEGFSKRDEVPQIGMLQMGSGTEPALCTIETRTKEQLDLAGATWFGAQRKRTP